MASRALAALVEIVRAHAGEAVLVVAHGGVLHSVLQRLGEKSVPYIHNCSLRECRVAADGQWRRGRVWQTNGGLLRNVDLGHQ